VAARCAPALQSARAPVGLESPSQRRFDRVFLQKIELDEIFSKNKIYIVKYPLELLQRSSYVFLNGLSRNVKQSSGFAEAR
jgi:DNA-binding PucR family transcriptional regulator